jgi:hypothetical protein
VRRSRRFPKRTHGKVFLTLNGVDYECSGTAVNAPSESLVITAGHCLYERFIFPAFATNWVFVPALRGSRRPFGKWPATDLATTSQFFQNDEDFRYDVGAATVSKKGGQTLQERLRGARGIAFKSKRNQTYRAFGYPAVSPPPEFDGRHPFRCKSSYRGSDHSENPPRPMRIACDMTEGSSGGGWVIDGGRVASVTSYSYAGESDRLYGPYFGPAIKSLYNAVKRG